MTGSNGKGVPMNGTWKWSDIVATREKGKHPPCWGAFRINGGQWIENPEIGRRNEVTK